MLITVYMNLLKGFHDALLETELLPAPGSHHSSKDLDP